MYAVEIRFAFGSDKSFATLVSGVPPTRGDGGGLMGGIADADQMKASLPDEVLVVAGRAEEVVADGAACGDILVRDDAADDQGVAEDEAASGLRMRKTS